MSYELWVMSYELIKKIKDKRKEQGIKNKRAEEQLWVMSYELWIKKKIKDKR